jgi:hypothetical protein
MQRCQTTDAYLVVKLRTISQATFNDPTVVHRSPSGGRFENAVVFRCMNMRREGAIMVEVRMMQTPCSQRRQWQTCRHSFNLVDRIDRRISVEHLTSHRRLLKGSPLPSSPFDLLFADDNGEWLFRRPAPNPMRHHSGVRSGPKIPFGPKHESRLTTCGGRVYVDTRPGGLWIAARCLRCPGCLCHPEPISAVEGGGQGGRKGGKVCLTQRSETGFAGWDTLLRLASSIF